MKRKQRVKVTKHSAFWKYRCPACLTTCYGWTTHNSAFLWAEFHAYSCAILNYINITQPKPM